MFAATGNHAEGVPSASSPAMIPIASPPSRESTAHADIATTRVSTPATGSATNPGVGNTCCAGCEPPATSRNVAIGAPPSAPEISFTHRFTAGIAISPRYGPHQPPDTPPIPFPQNGTTPP